MLHNDAVVFDKFVQTMVTEVSAAHPPPVAWLPVHVSRRLRIAAPWRAPIQIRNHVERAASASSMSMEELRIERDAATREVQDLHRQITQARAKAEEATRESVTLASQLQLAKSELLASQKTCVYLEELAEKARSEVKTVKEMTTIEV